MITLPDLFAKKISGRPALEASVRQTFDLFEPWLEQSGMPFFPGFTDHSPRHINDVLRTAASLIADTAHDLISAEDVAVLCMAILLHDSGMHLTQDLFRDLVADTGLPLIHGLGDTSWAQLWKDFLSEANRFGQDKLIAIFGDADPIIVGELKLENLSERDCLLIGEFVRRHHARLAHEIAVRGISRKDAAPLRIVGLDDDIRDISGLVARSHGMSIRETFSYIEQKYGLVAEYRNVKLPFLMAVLRIADYVQVKSERAIKALLSVKELRSPISRQEWLAHFAVKDVSTNHDDPEALYVQAVPADVKTFLKLEGLFRDIQRELDASWGTIGEIYGRKSKLTSLGLTVRRIRSNLDDTKNFSKSVTYIPLRAGFASSGPELLKLLVGPLYNYEYGVGIRELVQNAVDACRELHDLHGQAKRAPSKSTLPDVTVEIEELEDGTGWITVTDSGIGMTLDTVANYFLVAGASFRNSDIWKRQHTDDSGIARVIRGGRFGVGALAAFLLGDEIQVKTRHVDGSELEGVEFKARIDDPVVELRRSKAPVGTSIKVWVSDRNVFRKLAPSHLVSNLDGGTVTELDDWHSVDWFAQEKPNVIYRWNGYNKAAEEDYPPGPRVRVRAEFKVRKETIVPIPGSATLDWNILEDAASYKTILWRYIKPKRRSKSKTFEIQPTDEITVNGIRVQNIGGYRSAAIKISSDDRVSPEYSLSRPSMAIFDPAGVCPINLQRSEVAFEKMGVDTQLAKAILGNHLRQFPKFVAKVTTFDDFERVAQNIRNYRGLTYAGHVTPVCASIKGLFLSTPKFYVDLRVENLVFVVVSDSFKSKKISTVLRKGEGLLLRTKSMSSQAELALFRGLLANDFGWDWYARTAAIPQLRRRFSLCAILRSTWNSANETGKVHRSIMDSLEHQPLSKGHVWVMSGDIDAAKKSIPRAQNIFDSLGRNTEVAIWGLDEQQPFAEAKSLLSTTWIEIFGSAYIGPVKHQNRKR